MEACIDELLMDVLTWQFNVPAPIVDLQERIYDMADERNQGQFMLHAFQ